MINAVATTTITNKNKHTNKNHTDCNDNTNSASISNNDDFYSIVDSACQGYACSCGGLRGPGM